MHGGGVCGIIICAKAAAGTERNVFCTEMGGTSFSKVMEGIPTATDRTFRSNKVLNVLKTKTDEVVNGRDSYNTRFEDGTIKISKLRFNGLDRKTLKSTGELMKRELDVGVHNYMSLSLLLGVLSREDSEFDSDIVEEIESNKELTKFVYVTVKRNENNEYDLAFCYVESTVPINTGIMIGGLIKEGLLCKGEDDEIYLQL